MTHEPEQSKNSLSNKEIKHNTQDKVKLRAPDVPLPVDRIDKAHTDRQTREGERERETERERAESKTGNCTSQITCLICLFYSTPTCGPPTGPWRSEIKTGKMAIGSHSSANKSNSSASGVGAEGGGGRVVPRASTGIIPLMHSKGGVRVVRQRPLWAVGGTAAH